MQKIPIQIILRKVEFIETHCDLLDFYGEEIEPKEISYSPNTLNIGGVVLRVENGRYAFAQALSQYIEPNMHVFESNVICSNIHSPYPKRWGHNNVIGGSGFGYERSPDNRPYRIPHLGSVRFGEGVEIGSCVCIDRGVVDDTVIGDHTKIDNEVHIAHGAKIGKNVLIVAGSVIGGSTIIGDNCFLGINCSIKNKLRIGENVTIGMGAVVLSDVPDNTIVKGLWK